MSPGSHGISGSSTELSVLSFLICEMEVNHKCHFLKGRKHGCGSGRGRQAA